MQKWSVLGLLVLTICFGISCSQSKTASSSSFKVALLSPGPVSDAGWNASAYEGLQRIKAELGAEVSQVETKTPAEFEQGFRDYASQGYRLVFGHGFEFQDAAATVSKDFPNTVFITTSGTTVRPNVAPIVFEIEQATYLLGMMAARMSKTGKAGAVGGVQIPSVKSSFDAFEAGAKAVNPNCRVIVSYIGNWEDVGAAKEAALALIDQRVDFIFHNADAAGLGVFQAVQERKGVYAFGSNKDQNGIAPDVILASAALSVPGAFVTVAKQVKEGTFKAQPMHLGMKEGAVSLVINPKLESKIPPDVRTSIEETKQKILAGTLQVPKGFY
ncbi:MAG: BMP family protein [Candidatus Latescibacteria bacterium]|nr:BMP family protein [Candidatus Latescibacterota bacterium]